jgi:hypothetical protein
MTGRKTTKDKDERKMMKERKKEKKERKKRKEKIKSMEGSRNWKKSSLKSKATPPA